MILLVVTALSSPTGMAAPVPDRAVNSVPDNPVPSTSFADREPPSQQVYKDVQQALTDRSTQIRKHRAVAFSRQVAQTERVVKRTRLELKA